MASLTWLHLSDLHACRPETGWDAARVEETLVADVERLCRDHGLQPDLLFFTGDAAYGRIGDALQETVAGQLEVFAGLLDRVRRAIDPAFPWENVFLVPGNHDVDRLQVDPAQTEWLDRRRSLAEVQKLIDRGEVGWRNVMARLADYRAFLEHRPELAHLLADPERLIWGVRRRVAGLTVGIAGFNSAWSCGRDGEKGRLWMAGRWQQETLRPAIRDCDLAVALVHHPPAWLVEHESPAFGRRLRQDYRFLLHGHEHDDWVETSAGGEFTVVAAGACYQGSEKPNGYNVVRLDTETGRGEVWLRNYEAAGGGWEPRTVHGHTDGPGVWPLDLPWLAAKGGKSATRGGSKRRGTTTGDATTAQPATADDPPGLSGYLRRLRAAHRHVPTLGLKRRRLRLPIRLEDVYVQLRAHLYRRALEHEMHEFGAFRDFAAEASQERQVTVEEVLQLARRHELAGGVVLGDPGSGKTTLLKHFVLAATDPAQGPATLGLPEETVPVFIELRRLSRPAAGLEPALIEAVAAVDRSLDARSFARRLIARGRLLLLVDGLDEVTDRDQRAAVSRWLEAAIPNLPGSTFVLTSRYPAYKGNARLDGRFLELHVCDLAEPEARRFIAAWYRAVESQVDLGDDPETAAALATERSVELAEKIFDPGDPRTASLRRLARNPLMLQVLCLVHRDRKTLPEDRAELYEECLLLLLELWRRTKELPLWLTGREALKLLQPLAWWLHTSQRKEAPPAELLPRLAAPLRELGRDAAEADRLLAAIRDQSGVLVALGRGDYGFLHLSFQEYLAARHVQDRILAEPQLLAELASHFGDDPWREVLLLAVGLDNPPLFAPLLTQLLRQQVLHRDAALAGDLLRDALVTTPVPVLEALAAGIDSTAERYAALRLLKGLSGWQQVELATGARGEAVVSALAQRDQDDQVQSLASELLGTARVAEPVLTVETPHTGKERVHPADGSVLVFVPGGEYILGADDLEELGLEAEYAAWAKPVHRVRLSPFWIGKYPVTNEQYARFLATNPEAEPPENWDDDRFNQPEQPVVGVSWHDANAYCRWAGLGLPSEAQWEAAARGGDRRRYPWGDQPPTAELANFGGEVGKPTPVGAYPAGAGPFGALDQAGNVWEWCADGWDEAAYRDRDGDVDPVVPPGEDEPADVVLRGGSWAYPALYLAAALRGGSWATGRRQSVGFRCVLVSVSEHD